MTSVLWYSNETPDAGGQGGQRRQYFQIRSLLEDGHDVAVVSLDGDQDDTSIAALTDVRRLPGPGAHAMVAGPRGCRRGGRPARRPLRARRHRAHRVVDAPARRLELPGPRLLDLHNVFSTWYDAQGKARQGQLAPVGGPGRAGLDALAVCSLRERDAWLDTPDATPSSSRTGSSHSSGSSTPARWRPPCAALRQLGLGTQPPGSGVVPRAGRTPPRSAPSGSRSPDAGPSAGTALPCHSPRQGPRPRGVPGRRLGRGPPRPQGVGAPVKYAEALVTGVPLVATSDAVGRQHARGRARQRRRRAVGHASRGGGGSSHVTGGRYPASYGDARRSFVAQRECAVARVGRAVRTTRAPTARRTVHGPTGPGCRTAPCAARAGP